MNKVISANKVAKIPKTNGFTNIFTSLPHILFLCYNFTIFFMKRGEIMETEIIVASYTTAKICGYKGSYDDFKKLYDQYYSETINSLPTKEPQLAKVEAINNPLRNSKYF